MDTNAIYNELNILDMQATHESNLVHIGYLLDQLPEGDPARKLLVSLERHNSDALEKIEQLFLLTKAA